MKLSIIHSCTVSPGISGEQFIAEHFFLYLLKGRMTGYDGNREFKVKAGECGIGRRNHLAKYNKQPEDGGFEKIVIFFDQPFLRAFNEKHHYQADPSKLTASIVKFNKSVLIDNFIASLIPYFTESGRIDDFFYEVKRTELLLILLKENPGLANIFFDFGTPEKVDLESFMMRHYRYNVSLERFAYLTGRSLSVFKRDFEKIFSQTPGKWLVQKRLQEAHFLIHRKNQKPADIYLDLGFEDLSHFSFAFKKAFGHSPGRPGSA